MLKHVREAIKMAGVPLSEIEYNNGTRHPYLVVSGKKITFALSPKDKNTAAMRIARDIKRTMEQA